MHMNEMEDIVAEFGDVERNPLSFEQFLEILESQVLPKYARGQDIHESARQETMEI